MFSVQYHGQVKQPCLIGIGLLSFKQEKKIFSSSEIGPWPEQFQVAALAVFPDTVIVGDNRGAFRNKIDTVR